MTDPVDPTASEPLSAPTGDPPADPDVPSPLPSTTDPAPEPAPLPPSDAASPTPPAVPGWVAPDGGARSGRRTGCVVAVVVLAGVVFFSFIGLVFLGGQVQNLLKGTVQFGTGGSECSLTQTGTTFASTDTIHLAAHFERTVAAGETVTMVVSYEDGTSETSDETFDEPTDCLFMDLGPGVPAGRDPVEVRAGTEVLARGELDITP